MPASKLPSLRPGSVETQQRLNVFVGDRTTIRTARERGENRLRARLFVAAAGGPAGKNPPLAGGVTSAKNLGGTGEHHVVDRGVTVGHLVNGESKVGLARPRRSYTFELDPFGSKGDPDHPGPAFAEK